MYVEMHSFSHVYENIYFFTRQRIICKKKTTLFQEAKLNKDEFHIILNSLPQFRST